MRWLAAVLFICACSRHPTAIGADDGAPEASTRCDVTLKPWTGPRKVSRESKTYCVGGLVLDARDDSELIADGTKLGCVYSAPTGAYILACPGFRLVGGGPLTNFATIELAPPPTP